MKTKNSSKKLSVWGWLRTTHVALLATMVMITISVLILYPFEFNGGQPLCPVVVIVTVPYSAIYLFAFIEGTICYWSGKKPPRL